METFVLCTFAEIVQPGRKFSPLRLLSFESADVVLGTDIGIIALEITPVGGPKHDAQIEHAYLDKLPGSSFDFILSLHL
jgi:hypothetical protein